jgi:hypothetical protein
MKPDCSRPEKLPDPWLFDSEALLRQLDRCRELTNQIPITDPNSTHLSIQIAVNAQWNLRENIRYILHLHREGQRAFRKQQERELQQTLSQQHPKNTIVHLHTTPSRNKAHQKHHDHTNSQSR